VLDYRLGGLNIAEVLDLPVADAIGYFGTGAARTPAAHAIVRRMADVGLGTCASASRCPRSRAASASG
jgi:excinuclease UvrABC ATPase subunit